jgi:hypothetical protein
VQVTQALLRLSIRRDLENLSLSVDKQSHATATLEQIAQQVKVQSGELGANGALGLVAATEAPLSADEALQSVQRLMEMQMVFEDPGGGVSFDQFAAMHAVGVQSTVSHLMTCVQSHLQA